jgi:hypothetical protein
MKGLWIFAAMLITVGVFAQAPKPGLNQATVGKAFSLTLPQMVGATSCTASKLGLSQSAAFNYAPATATVSGTPTKPGFAALKIRCIWNTTPPKGATQLVQIRVSPAAPAPQIKAATTAPATSPAK